MEKQRLGAIIIGLIMLFSVAGFASVGLRFTGDAVQDQPQEQTIPTTVDRFLTGQEISLILRQGRAVIESVYNKNCQECKQKDGELRFFATRFGGFVILESVETEYGEGWERFQIIGSNGEIKDLKEEEISQENLLNLSCDLLVVKPRECLLKIYEQPLNTS